MATVIRMRRGGRTHAPYYRVVVADSRTRNRGPVIEQIGIYQPAARPEPKIEIDAVKALEWLQKGAEVSDTVRSVFQQKGIMKALADGKKPEDLAPAPQEPQGSSEEAAPEAATAEPAPSETVAPAAGQEADPEAAPAQDSPEE